MADSTPVRRDPRLIAIDGPAASGKSTTARRVAERLGFVHLNSGLLYRAITWRALQEGWGEDDPGLDARVPELDIALLSEGPGLRVQIDGRDPGPALQGPEVSARVSAVSARPVVRAAVFRRLREARERFDLVCDGRDIGTTVFPDADLKVFLIADPEERARRRLLERGVAGGEAEIAREASRLRARDEADASREHSPLRRAADAVEIDTTDRTPEQVVEAIVRLARERGAAEPPPGA